jgi:competence ComEA-like helix-hairpin-helix protein
MLEFSLQEKRFVLFLLTTFLVGCGVTFYRQIRGDASLERWREQQLLLSRQISSLTLAYVRPAEQSPQTLLEKKHRLIAKLNLNTATAEELATLERIGPALAERIIRYREEHGPFKTVEQLQRVKGIGPKTFSRIRERIGIE